MNIIIIANFPSALDGVNKGRFMTIAEMLAERGHNVQFVTSNFDHWKKSHRGRISKGYKVPIIQLPELGYLRNVSIKRLYSHYCWGKEVEKYLKSQNNIDLIYTAIPSLTAAKVAARYAKKKGAKFVVDLQDLWPEAFAMVIKNKLFHKLFLPMKWYVDASYKAANLAVAVSDTYVDRILQVNEKLKSGVSVFLGNDGEAFEKGRENFKLEREDDEIVVGYIGNMSTSYDMPCVMDALSIVKKRGKVKHPLRFVLVGGGVDEDKFKEYAEKVYPNTTFLGRKSYQEMAGLLCGCDIVVNPIVKGSVASIINKVGDYALSGKPVINTQESMEYRYLVDAYNCGINCECGNAVQVADAIERLALDSLLREEMGKNAARLGREKFDRRFTYHKIVEAIEQFDKRKITENIDHV